MGWFYLFISVLCSSALFVIFRYFEKFKVNVLPAIVINYIIASGFSFVHQHEIPKISFVTDTEYGLTALLLGIIFITLFQVMAYSSQKIGVASTTIANKTTFVFPVLLGVFFLDEPNIWPKYLGIIAAILAIYTTSSEKKSESSVHNLSILALLFFGGGILEALLGYSEAKLVPKTETGIFTGLIFLFAAIAGLILLLFKRQKINLKSILWGTILGIPNYLSIYLFVYSFRYPGIEKSIAFPIANMGIIIVATLASFFLFKEKIHSKKIVAILLALISITLFSFSQEILNAF